MKTNPPTLRIKDRYVLFRVHSAEPVDYYNLKNAVFSSIMDFIGESGAAKAGVVFVKNLWKQQEQTGVFRCSAKSLDIVKVSISMVHQIGDSKVSVQTLNVSGSIKGLGKKQS